MATSVIRSPCYYSHFLTTQHNGHTFSCKKKPSLIQSPFNTANFFGAHWCLYKLGSTVLMLSTDFRFYNIPIIVKVNSTNCIPKTCTRLTLWWEDYSWFTMKYSWAKTSKYDNLKSDIRETQIKSADRKQFCI